ncbi:hypothetical protein B0H34DRAFT_796074 [Crassisporium funariophilum]|nr:hypothetical protein B0H34DRAFT_796074 [Crassisporium funariophilum]
MADLYFDQDLKLEYSPFDGIYMPSEPARLSSNWPSPSRRSPLNYRQLSIDSGRYPPEHYGGINRIWTEHGSVELPAHQTIVSNLFGRSMEDAFGGLRLLHASGAKSPRNTPSLASDDSHSQPTSNASSPVVANEPEPEPPSPTPPKLNIDGCILQLVDEGTPLDLATQSVEIDEPPAQQQLSTDISGDSTENHERDIVHATSSVPHPPLELGASGSSLPLNAQSIHTKRSKKISASTKSRTLTRTPASVVQPHSNDDNVDRPPDSFADECYAPASGPQRRKVKASTSSKRQVPCTMCARTFTRPYDLRRHIKEIHPDPSEDREEKFIAQTCANCGVLTQSRWDAFIRHRRNVPQSCNTLASRNNKERPKRQSQQFYQQVRDGIVVYDPVNWPPETL